MADLLIEELRRITVKLDDATRDGDQEIHLLTNVPAAAADAITIAELYRKRWKIENAFQELGQAKLLAAAARAAVGLTINIACGKSYDLPQLSAAINRIVGTDIERLFEPARSGDVARAWPNFSSARGSANRADS